MPSSSELQAWCLNTALANLQLQRRKIRLAAVTGNVVELKRAGMNLASVTDNQVNNHLPEISILSSNCFVSSTNIALIDISLWSGDSGGLSCTLPLSMDNLKS